MKQLDMFNDKMNWPNDFDGAHSVASVKAGICRAAPDGIHILVDSGTSDPLYGAVPPKIYESPDKGQTVYERDFGSHPSTRRIVKTAVQQQWKITFKGEEVSVPQNLISLV